MEEKIATLVEQVPLGIIAFTSNGDIEFVNQNFKKYSILYQLASPYEEFNVFEDGLFATTSIKKELKEILEGLPFEKEVKHIPTSDGGKISVIVKGSPIYEDDIIIGGILVVEDIKIPGRAREEIKPVDEPAIASAKEKNSFLIVTNNEGVIQSTKGEVKSSLLSTSEPLLGKNILEIINPSITHLLVKNYNRVFKKKQLVSFKFSLDVKDEQLYYECKLEPHLNPEGKIQLIHFSIRNLIEETAALTENEKKELEYYREAAANFSHAVLAVDKKGIIKKWDNNSESFFKLSSNFVLGKFLWEIFNFISEEKFNSAIQKLEQNHASSISGRFASKENITSKLEFLFAQAAEESDTVLIFCREAAGKQIHLEKSTLTSDGLKELFKSVEEPVCKIDSNGTILISNPAFKAKLGYPDIELYRTNFLGLIKQDNIEREKLNLDSIKNELVKKANLNLLSFNGDSHPFDVTFVPDKETDVQSRTYYCHFAEVQTEKEIQPELSLYKSLFKASQDGIAVGRDGNIVMANDSFAEIFGFEKAEDVYNKNLLDFVSNDDVLKVAEYFKLKEKRENGPDRFEFLAKKRDNSQFYAELSVASFNGEDKPHLVVIARDVTERKRAQKVIRESEQKYRNITENIDDFLYTFERSGKYLRPLFYSASVEKVTGYTQAEFLSDSKLFLKIIHPDDFTSLKKKLGTLWRSGFHSSSELEFRLLNKQGNVVWVRNKVNIIRDAKGGIQKIYGLVSDVTLRKRAEEELKESTSNLKKLNEAKDRFLSIISHDLRTPFSSILGFTDLLLTDETLNEQERKQYVKYIQDSSKSMLALVNSLLDWTRLQTGRIKFESEKLNARELIEKSISTGAGTALQKQVEIENSIQSSLNIFVDKNLAQQVFNNLISNAVKFTTKGDKITISAKPAERSRFLQFSIKDTGRGIKPANLPKLFNIDMKFTSEGTAGEKGSGLGLSLVKEIVEKHGGLVKVKSEYGSGSEFILTLPVASNRILIVDNNKTDRILYSKILKNITPDFSVDIVSNGKEALDKISSSPPALVITENEMPVMNGYNFVLELIRLNLINILPVMVLSGKIDRNISQDYAELGIEYIFQKPVNLKDFKVAVEKSIRKGITGNNNST
jgi:PAS domain S-box-containing protein